MPKELTTNEKLEILIALGADADTLIRIAIVMNDSDFDELCNDLVGEYTGDGKRFDLFALHALEMTLNGIFA